MKLSSWERRQLLEIERGLSRSDPNLHRALAAMTPDALSGPEHRPAPARAVRIRLALLVILLCVGLAMLVTGLMLTIAPLAVAGLVLSQAGPAGAYWLLVRRRRTRRSSGAVHPVPRRTVGRRRRPRAHRIRLRRPRGGRSDRSSECRSPPVSGTFSGRIG